MKVQIQFSEINLSDEVRRHVLRRLHNALNHGAKLVSRVVIRLSDINGPRGGEDKCCAIEVSLAGGDAVYAKGVQGNVFGAINLAARRLGQCFDHQLARSHRQAGRRRTIRAPALLATPA